MWLKLAYEVDLDELQKTEIIDANKILHEFFSPENISLKTEINAPSEFTTLETISDIKIFNYLINFGGERNKKGKIKHKHKFVKVPILLQEWISKYKINMVTYGRKSRLEVADVLKAIKEQEKESRGLLQKLTGMGKE